MEKLSDIKWGRSDICRIADYLDGKRIPTHTSKKIKSFVRKARSLKYKYGDLHGGNIMKSKRGALKFIDLESFTY